MHAILLRACLLLGTASPGATPAAAYVVGAAPGQQPSDAPVHALGGTKVTLYAVVRVGRGARARYYTDARSLRLRGRRIAKRRLRPLSRLGRVALRWYLVEPHPHHVKRAPPNKGQPEYANSVLYGRHHGRWIGFDRLEYHETLLGKQRGPTLVVSRATPTHKKIAVHGGLGTMRYKVAVRWGGRRVASPGASDNRPGGISSRVMRVSWRAGHGFLGHLTSFYNVPYVFGSAGRGKRHQTDRYQGTDCADVLVGAARRAGARLAYTHVSGLTRYARPLGERLLISGKSVTWASGPRKGRVARLRFGTDVRPGDLLLIDFVGWTGSPRGWDHVAVLWGDRGQKGLFDPADLVLHMHNLWGLVKEPVSGQGRVVVQLLRFRKSVRRAFARHRKRHARRAKKARRGRR